MMREMNGRSLVIGAALITAILGASPAAAVLQGDCNDDGTTAINEVQRCANIFLETQALALCPPCDQNGNGAVAINEVAGASNCFLDTGSAGCRMSTPGPGVATSTPTNTPAATATNTQVVVPTNTNTPVTPTATNTPVTPTATNTPQNTPTPTEAPTTGTILMGIAPGGGTAANCRGTCVSGSNMGGSCSANDQCPGSTCSPTSICTGGTNNGNSCTTNAQCPGGGTCGPARTCVGGGYDGFMCSSGNNCNGCDPNRICRGAGNPIACCTGNQAGTCPLRGSCAIIQGTIPVRVSLNGVCLPRSYPPGDIGCVTDVECRTCVGGGSDGKACSQASHCPDGACSNPGVCQLAEVGAIVGPEDANGERSIQLLQETLVLNPAYIPSLGTACVIAGGDGAGVIDCNGGRIDRDFTLKKDHNTTPGSPGNSGTASGSPDDADCGDTFVAPNGTVNYTCVEGMMQCADGVNAAEPCTMDEQCPGSNCASCNIGANGGPHTGVCNGPTILESEGTFLAGDAAVALPLAISLLDAASVPPPADYGADGLPCTPDDAAPPGNAVPVALSTGTNEVIIYDRANTAGLVLAPGQQCGAFPCAASVSGQRISCGVIDSGTLAGLALGGGFPALDSPAGDIATTFQFTLEDRD